MGPLDQPVCGVYDTNKLPAGRVLVYLSGFESHFGVMSFGKRDSGHSGLQMLAGIVGAFSVVGHDHALF
jgi:hypothetical protein